MKVPRLVQLCGSRALRTRLPCRAHGGQVRACRRIGVEHGPPTSTASFSSTVGRSLSQLISEFALRCMTSLSDSPCWYRLGSRLKSRVRASREGIINYGRGRVLATIFGGIQNSDCHGASEWGVRSNTIRPFIATKTKQDQHPLDIDNAHRFPAGAALCSTKTAK